jgi:hypothetical protein
LREQLAHLEYWDAAIARLDTDLAARLAVEQEAVALLQTIPGVAGAPPKGSSLRSA